MGWLHNVKTFLKDVEGAFVQVIDELVDDEDVNEDGRD